MRYKLYFKLNKPLKLKLNYHEDIQRFIYLLFTKENKEYAQFLHNQGYGEIKKYKLFTFSKLYSPKRTIKNHEIIFEDMLILNIAGVDTNFDQYLLNTLNNYTNFKLQDQNIILKKYQIFKYNYNKQIKIKLLSPIVIRKTYLKENKKKTYYFNPLEKDFTERINNLFKKKYEAYYGITSEDITIKLVSVNEKDKYVTKYKNTYITAWHGTYLLQGKKEYLEFLYYIGLGEKTSQGFGMFEVIE
ncbi:CRISPR-associated endoribonuclease Cas6 [Thomasclavelia cocleata]|uniref:CRISPR-associated endoribonuclease Cas6 n=1 Tax=Thomasclavelia cocleata TaxID=69824 RepID=UPI002557CA7F|nr:CRISPR-associated endoribonuclease Cas6 [Thomasclavelia cocleata]